MKTDCPGSLDGFADSLESYANFLESYADRVCSFLEQFEGRIVDEVKVPNKVYTARTLSLNAMALVMARLFASYVRPFAGEKTEEAMNRFYKKVQDVLQEELSLASGKTAFSMELRTGDEEEGGPHAQG